MNESYHISLSQVSYLLEETRAKKRRDWVTTKRRARNASSADFLSSTWSIKNVSLFRLKGIAERGAREGEQEVDDQRDSRAWGRWRSRKMKREKKRRI